MTDRHPDGEASVRLRAALARPAPLNPLDGAALLAHARERRRAVRRASATAGALLLGGVALGIGTLVGPGGAPPGDEPASLLARGVEVPSVHLELSWLVQDDRVRRVRPDSVAAGQRVLFHASTDRDGWLCLSELDESLRWRPILDPAHPWRATRGTSFYAPQGDVQAFRTDQGAGVRAYRLSFDPSDPTCAHAEGHVDAELRWLP